LGTPSTGRATPYFFTVYLGQTKGCFPDYLANAELPDPVPRTNRIAQSALKAEPEGISTSLYYFIDYFFEGGDCFHCPYQSSSFACLI
jgi:hypothetical protein